MEVLFFLKKCQLKCAFHSAILGLFSTFSAIVLLILVRKHSNFAQCLHTY